MSSCLVSSRKVSEVEELVEGRTYQEYILYYIYSWLYYIGLGEIGSWINVCFNLILSLLCNTCSFNIAKFLHCNK